MSVPYWDTSMLIFAQRSHQRNTSAAQVPLCSAGIKKYDDQLLFPTRRGSSESRTLWSVSDAVGHEGKVLWRSLKLYEKWPSQQIRPCEAGGVQRGVKQIIKPLQLWCNEVTTQRQRHWGVMLTWMPISSMCQRERSSDNQHFDLSFQRTIRKLTEFKQRSNSWWLNSRSIRASRAPFNVGKFGKWGQREPGKLYGNSSMSRFHEHFFH